MSLSTYDQQKADRAAKRRAEIAMQMERMEEAASVSFMDIMSSRDGDGSITDGSSKGDASHDGGVPPPESPQPSVGSRSSATTEASSSNGAAVDELSVPSLSHEQIRENARRVLDADSTSASYAPASRKKLGGVNHAPPRHERHASALERAKQFLFDDDDNAGGTVAPPGSTRSVPGLALGGTLGMTPDKSTSPDRRRAYSTRSYGEGMRDSMKSLFSQVQHRLHLQEAKKKMGVGNAEERNLAPRGTGMGSVGGSATLKNVNLHDSGQGMNYNGETFFERTRYSCWEKCGREEEGCGGWCRSHSKGMTLALMMVLIAGSVAAIFVAIYDGEQEFVRERTVGGSGGGGGSEADTDGASEVAENMVNGTFVGMEDLEDLPSIDTAAAGLRFGRIKERIVEMGISSEDSLSYSTDSGAAPTAQFRALSWISVQDAMTLDPEDEYLPQRYALATFWYSTLSSENSKEGGTGTATEWEDGTNWMTPRGYCSWHGVSCHHRSGAKPADVHYDGNNGITSLNLTSNGVGGRMPPELFRALGADVRHVDLSDNSLSGAIPNALGAATQLESLYLWGNRLEDRIPPVAIGGLTSIRNLHLHGNMLDGPLPSQLGRLTELRNLGLHSNLFTGSIPSELGVLAHVRSLYLDSNNLSGPVPPSIFGMEGLVDLRLRENDLTGNFSSQSASGGPGPSELEVLHIDGNRFAGPLPPDLGSDMPRLRELHLQHCDFTGTLPPEWKSLAELRELKLEGNDIVGAIPAEWGADGMGDLRVLDLAGNGMEGAVPTTIGKMLELRELRLNDNGGLSGSVPAELGDAFNLEIVHLHNNQLAESLPGAIGNLNHLKSLKVHGNALSGNVPPKVCDLTEGESLEELTADCAGESPLVVCSCCSECFEGSRSSLEPGGAETGTRP
mmetsp:Transcript_39510/g.118591  ORF Transcript_39510/g.118591 Transcript_39510/m.118591 type:complete len:903 (-) Transcript_39510:244-2952(-)